MAAGSVPNMCVVMSVETLCICGPLHEIRKLQGSKFMERHVKAQTCCKCANKCMGRKQLGETGIPSLYIIILEEWAQDLEMSIEADLMNSTGKGSMGTVSFSTAS